MLRKRTTFQRIDSPSGYPEGLLASMPIKPQHIAIHGNVNQTTFQELQKFALCENQKVAIEPKLASCILVVLAGCLTAAFVWFTFICR